MSIGWPVRATRRVAGTCSRASCRRRGCRRVCRLLHRSSTMRCVEIREPGGPEVLQIAERPDPVPGPGEVLIAVVAAGVNRPDVLQRRGGYPPPKGASDLPGLEVSGTVLEVGDGVPPS